jgi:hypothetical protein
MARSTFSGPILAGDNKEGPQRNVGFTRLVQNVFLDFSVSTNGANNYGGASGQFATSVPNAGYGANENATIFTPQAGISVASMTQVNPTADASGTNYRGAVFYIPQGCSIQEILIDNVVQPTDGTHAVTSIQPYISNTFATSGGVYATSAAITGSTIGRTTATFTAAQYQNSWNSLADVQNIFWPNVTAPGFVSQVVVTLAMTVASLTSVNAGQMIITLKYNQPDTGIGNVSNYPYGNVG